MDRTSCEKLYDRFQHNAILGRMFTFTLPKLLEFVQQIALPSLDRTRMPTVTGMQNRASRRRKVSAQG